MKCLLLVAILFRAVGVTGKPSQAPAKEQQTSQPQAPASLTEDNRRLIGFSGSYFCVPGSPPNTRCPFTPACCTGSALSLGGGVTPPPADGTKFFQ
jgi:hypothetical protein